tara:strand:- start:845 stop:3712 length:2868 start_codon:yes stop_codon:yes gene_type:complete
MMLMRKSLGMVLLLLTAVAVKAAAPVAGTVIKNQASASYRACLDDACTRLAEAQRVTSNLVETLIQAVPGIELVSAQSKPSLPGGVLYFPHTLTNTGNGRDRYQLCLENVDSDIAAWFVFPDANDDGQPDSGAPLFSHTDADGCWDVLTPDLLAGDSYGVVIEVEVDGAAISGQSLTLDIAATSNSNAALTDSNTDTITLIDGPVLEVVKSLSIRQGRSPSGPVTVTLAYRNPSDQVATQVEIEDTLPQLSVDGVNAGMSYVPGSARWTVTGSTELTDDGDDGSQGSAPDQIDYCAYDAGAANSDCHDRVRAVLAQLSPGAAGSLTFDVNIDAGLAAGDRVRNLATVSYQNGDGSSTFGPFDSNTVDYRIIERALLPAVVANNSESDSLIGEDDTSNTGNRVELASLGQGGVASFSNVIWNRGDGEDSFDILVEPEEDRLGAALANPFPTGTVFQLYKSDGGTPLVDTDGNGVADTGPIPLPDAGGQCPPRFVTDSMNLACGVRVVLQATLPPDALGGPFEVTKVARSVTDPQVSNAVTDVLTSILANSVDLTNDQPVNGSAPGEGAGPEATPVQTVNVAPGEQAVLRLVVNNTGARQDSYDLAVSDSDFVPGQLPAGWQVAFYRDGGNGDCATVGAALTNTGLIPAGDNLLVCAQVTAPTEAQGGDTENLYFRAQSPTSGASDIKLDAVAVVAGPALALTPDQVGQVEPGSSVVYTHQLTNTGNVPLDNVLLSGTPDAATDNGWSVVLYEDSNGDGVWGPADAVINDGVALQTAGNDGILDVGESLAIFAKVFAPASVAYGITNVKTLTVTADGAGQSVSDSATDTTTTNNTDVAITKEQALDADCDGIPDGPGTCSGDNCFVFTRFEVTPGQQCVIYRLTATNTGAEPMYQVTINDRTQPFTTLLAVATACEAPLGSCNTVAPVDGATGDISAEAGLLEAGENAVLIFGLRVE